MLKRFFVLLPIIASMVLFMAPTLTTAQTLPNICSKGKWISCGNNAYYCTAMKGDSCKVPTFAVTHRLENWSTKQQQAKKVKIGTVVKSAAVTKYVYKYITKKVCTVKNQKKTCTYKRLLTKVVKR